MGRTRKSSHNPKVDSSSLSPATTNTKGSSDLLEPHFYILA